MLRRSMSVTVMLGFAIGQMAAFPHAHSEGGQSADHNARPHIHVALLAHGSHSRDGENCRHHPADGSHSHSPPPEAETEHDEHDSDAVYLSNDIGHSLLNKSVGPISDFEFIVTLATPVAPTATSVTDYVSGPFLPGNCGPGRPLYLALRTLRI